MANLVVSVDDVQFRLPTVVQDVLNDITDDRVATALAPVALTADLPTADTLPGATSVGVSLIKATTTTAAQTALGVTSVGKGLLTATDTSTLRTGIGLPGSPYFVREVEKYYISRSDVSGLTTVKPVIDACTAAAVADGVRNVVLPAGVLPVTAQMRIPATNAITIEGQGEDTVLQQTVTGYAKAMFVAGGGSPAGYEGTKVALTGDLAAGAQVVTVPSAVASALTVGDCVGFECSTIVMGIGTGTQESRASEYHNVWAVSGNSVTLDSPLIFDYTVAATALAYKVFLGAPVRFKNMRFTSNAPLTNGGRFVYLEKLRDPSIENVTITDAAGGVYIHDCMRGTVDNVTINKLSQITNYRGYGVVVSGRSANVTVNNLQGWGIRHLFTTLADERSDTTQWGGPRNIIVSNGVGYGGPDTIGYAIWDTHPPGYDITFSNVQAVGGTGAGTVGIQVRSLKTKIVNPTVRDVSGPGINVQESASDCSILGGSVSSSGGGGIIVGAADVRIDGVRIDQNNGPGIYYDATGTNLQVVNNHITENLNYGIQCVGANGTGAGVVIKDNVIPKGTSGRQALSMLAPKQPAVVANNILRGYGSGTTGVYIPETGLTITGNVTD